MWASRWVEKPEFDKKMMKTVQFKERRIAPSKILCVGRNYSEHIAELGNEVPDSMVVFFKPNSAISDRLVVGSVEPLHYEAEICYLVEAGELAGIGVGLDLTRRTLQSRLKEKGLPWERAKAFDGAAVFGEFVRLPDGDAPVQVKLQIDGRTAQAGDSRQMIYSPAQVLAELKTFTSLYDGDVIMTGTPKGVGIVSPGAEFVATVGTEQSELVRQSWIAEAQ